MPLEPAAQRFVDLAITPGGRVGDASSLAKPGYKGKRRLTDYEREIAHALMRKRGMSKSHAIAVAKNATKRWARGGGKVRPQVRAGAAASIAQSHALSVHQRGVLDLAVQAAAERDIDLSWRSDLHPRDWRGRFGKKNALSGELDGKGRPVPSANESHRLDVHTRRADSLLIEHSSRLSTDNNGIDGQHVITGHDADGKPQIAIQWSKERAMMQAKLVDTVYRREAKKAKADRKALFLGGLPGAGKSTSIKNIPGLNQDDYITINPDIFKEELARRGHVPQVEGLSPMEASAFVHEESSQMALALAAKATANGKNIIWDITMNKASSVQSRMKPLKEAGYTTNAVFVDIPHSMSQQRVEQRHRGGELSRMRDTTGMHLGQRLVPSTHVAGGKSKKGSSSANRDAFEEIKHQFDAHKLYDNSGKDPVLLEERGKFKP